MQLLILTTVRSYEKQAVQLFHKAGIQAFSTTNIKGYKSQDHENLIDNWFSSTSDQVNSVLFFTFAEQHKIDQLMSYLKKLNGDLKSNNPLKAIVLNIEKHI